MSDAASPPLPLRERKKQRTRQALIDTAGELFAERGVDSTTLDDLCAAVEISKRTFFRNFPSKEAVAMAPLHDLWAAFLAHLDHATPATGTLLDLLQDTLVAAVRETAVDGWPRRATRSHGLARTTPALAAHNLQFCDQTTRSALDLLHRDLRLTDDLHARLALDILVAAFHCALDTWSARTTFGTPELIAELRAAFAAVPGALTMRVEPR
ncbi:TetR/AcrR family transcriptional regulator [Nocardia sp. NPDC050712]|uniref:TetR/AcrR family transcriptional regulator n=1 Tax=Nocardia sp. NPDC050712 TaxID=3155518 RepID=UPI0033EB1F5C